MMNEAVFSSEPRTDLTGVWGRTLASIRGRVSPHTFEVYFRPLRAVEITEAHLQIEAQNDFLKDMVQNHYLDVIREELGAQGWQGGELKISAPAEAVEVEPVVEVKAPPEERFAFESNLIQRFVFDSFVIGPSNELGHAAARAVAENPGQSYNPLFLYGGVGLGKTHLLHAIGNAIGQAARPLKVIYLSGEGFMNEYISAVRNSDLTSFRRLFRRECEMLLIDDVQFISSPTRGQTQEEFFHTFEALYNTQRQIVVTSDKYPEEMKDLHSRLRTRFQWGLLADIRPPELETRVAILKRKAQAAQVELPDEVALFLGTAVDTNVRQLEGALTRLMAMAKLKNIAITMDLAQASLRGTISDLPKKPDVERVKAKVASHFNVSLEDLCSPKRSKDISLARQVAMYLCREKADASFPVIGQAFGNRDHSTVMSSCKKVAGQLNKDPKLSQAVGAILRNL